MPAAERFVALRELIERESEGMGEEDLRGGEEVKRTWTKALTERMAVSGCVLA